MRNVQFRRNVSVVTGLVSHDAAMTAALVVFNAQASNMKDGELVLYRYTITGETGSPVHTIVGVVRNDGQNTPTVEVLANRDMFPSVEEYTMVFTLDDDSTVTKTFIIKATNNNNN